MIQLTKEESQAITIVKVLCMFGVVYIHAAIKMYTECSASITTYYDFLTRVLPSFAVPGFFMCSGFLFYKNYTGISSYPRKAKSRFRSLVIPYLFWISLTLFVTWFLQDVLGFAKLFGAGDMKLIHDFSASDFVKAYWDLREGGPFLSTMWFLKDLIICVVIAPILYFLLEPKAMSFITMAGIILLSLIGFSFATVSITSVLWFSVGGLVSIHGIKVFDWIKNHFILLLILSLFFLIYGTYTYNENAPHSCLRTSLGLIKTFIVFLSFFSLSLKITNKSIGKELTLLGIPSYFIYLAHEPYMGYALQLLLNALKHAPVMVQHVTIIAIPILYPIIIIFICLAVFRVLKLIAPKALSIVVGGKV